jgi:hypothetical protein
MLEFEGGEMKKLVIVILILAFAGCTISRMENKELSSPVSMTSKVDGEKYTVVKHFEKKKKQWWFIWYIIPVSKTNLEELVGSEVAKGDGVVNLSTSTKWDFVDFAISILTGGLVNSVTVEVEGDVVDYK